MFSQIWSVIGWNTDMLSPNVRILIGDWTFDILSVNLRIFGYVGVKCVDIDQE